MNIAPEHALFAFLIAGQLVLALVAPFVAGGLMVRGLMQIGEAVRGRKS